MKHVDTVMSFHFYPEPPKHAGMAIDLSRVESENSEVKWDVIFIDSSSPEAIDPIELGLDFESAVQCFQNAVKSLINRALKEVGNE